MSSKISMATFHITPHYIIPALPATQTRLVKFPAVVEDEVDEKECGRKENNYHPQFRVFHEGRCHIRG